MLFLLFIPLVASQICISDYDCSQQERCLPYSVGVKRCTSPYGAYATPPSPYNDCFIDSDCLPSQVCVFSANGGRSCSNRAQQLSCVSDQDCGPKGACTRQPNGATRCTLAVGGGAKSLSTIGGSCQRDSDCQSNLQCVSTNGVLSCLLVTGSNILPPNSCESSMDCPQGENCVYSVGNGRLVCMSLGGPVAGGQVTSPGPQIGNIGQNRAYDETPNKETMAQFENFQMDQASDSILLESNSTIIPTYAVVKKSDNSLRHHPIIDPAALPCEFDYQCRMGEACTGYVHTVDRNISVCRYDINKANRSCITNSDCIQGQKCAEVVKGEPFVCRTSLMATLADAACIFDYECSGGEKCINVGNETARMFRCRLSKFSDPRRNRPCHSNADCPFQQVCRLVAEMPLCVDVGSSISSAGTEEIQKKIVDFVQNLLFARV